MLQVLNAMYIGGQITETQKTEILVCIPKTPHPNSPADYCPLTLLIADYKILTHILASRIKPWLPNVLHPGQHCGVSGATVYDALEVVRDMISSATYKWKPLCILSLDFKEAFDNISHTYFFALLKAYGFSQHLQDRIHDLYMDTSSQVKVNGFLSGAIPIRCSLRQGCPLSMILFALCLDPLLHSITQKLSGYRVGRTLARTAVVAYADDVVVFLTSPAEIQELETILAAYTAATGAQVNVAKSKAMAEGMWDTNINVLYIPYFAEMKILGLRFTTSFDQATAENWDTVTGQIQAKTRDMYYRELGLAGKIQYIHCYILATAWYTAQIFRIPESNVRQINSIIAWFIWRGEIFRVPLSTLRRAKRHDGWGLVDLAAKCRALYLCRCCCIIWMVDRLHPSGPERGVSATQCKIHPISRHCLPHWGTSMLMPLMQHMLPTLLPQIHAKHTVAGFTN
jgi:hypothetical protein